MKIQQKTIFLALTLLLVTLSFTSCTHKVDDKSKAPPILKAASFGDLPRWNDDDHMAALGAFEKSCRRIMNRPADRSFGSGDFAGTYADWHPLCRNILAGEITDLQEFLETNFRPWAVTTQKHGAKGLFTGYYEPSLRGAPIKTGPYQYPLRAMPEDLVMVDLGAFRDDLKGRRIAGRVENNRLRPYEDRAEITGGALPAAMDKPIVWVDDKVGVFFLHIQGSGRVIMPDGSFVRVGYAGQNGHPYYAIGRELIKRGHLTKDEVSLQTIRAWLVNNPTQAREIMFTNKSYVFFRKLDEDGSIGGEGIVLTPERSLAIDHSKMPYGLPLWVDIDPPTDTQQPLRKLMIAQDTGGAIRGAVRGDVFWGHGDHAEYLAGHMKAEGRYWVLLPKTVNPAP